MLLVIPSTLVRPDFLLVDLREFFFRPRVEGVGGGGGGDEKINKKALKMTSDWSFSELFFCF